MRSGNFSHHLRNYYLHVMLRFNSYVERTLLMFNKKSILCIVPLPPPISGAAAASETIVNFLKEHHNVLVVAYQRGNLISSKFSMRQMVRILAIGIKLLFIDRTIDSVYLVISSSFLGNMRDLFFLMTMGMNLRRKTNLHFHGGNFDRYIHDAPSLVKSINKKLLGEASHAIVLGESFKDIFDGYVQSHKIRIVKNYYKQDLLISEERLNAKFTEVKKIKILFLSNLINEKGYTLLLDAFLSLPEEISRNAELHFAGELQSCEKKGIFEVKIKENKNIYYHGQVAGKDKQDLLWNAHIFCLPTLYKFEGQPISILEAYAAGSIVITTLHGGIRDIFVNESNGYSLDVDLEIDPVNLKEKLKDKLIESFATIIKDINEYKEIAYFNRKEAMKKYTERSYCENIEKILTESDVNNLSST